MSKAQEHADWLRGIDLPSHVLNKASIRRVADFLESQQSKIEYLSAWAQKQGPTRYVPLIPVGFRTQGYDTRKAAVEAARESSMPATYILIAYANGDLQLEDIHGELEVGRDDD